MFKLKKYKNFINESVNSEMSINNMNDVPNEVISTSKSIANGLFDKVKKVSFRIDDDKNLIIKFGITEQDFKYIDQDEDLTSDLNDGAKKKRLYDVSLTFLNSISETYEVEFIVNFHLKTDDNKIELDINDDDDDMDDNYYKNDDEDYIDDDDIDNNIMKNKNREPFIANKFDDDIIIDDDDDDID
jgi:hypothetical protein